ncbi:hypothetical protein [Mesorhizobium sp. M1B.F.Ca.ET.045.04.1.1]|uniref:hypothetical protein n=1 Tax=Mesorhizobium sp. M1B.F.Ca.ET.045.04.1.1 TaxID=2493673 RepID=UPI000F756440|nr:hypothetical protein [Mesorhizobium sp. M1B.F.Ca.ET.045.04.1.1]AZO29391.1 hypothetical protein EJ071_19690 [Mesorhizobium sp. M1B.F.Ca.ET.045.04.1.1]
MIEDLIARLEQLEAPDRDIDRELGALWPEPRPFNISLAAMRNGMPICPAFTSDLNAAVKLLERILPGFAWKIGTCCVSDDAWVVPDFNCPTHGERLLKEYGKPAPRSIWDVGIDIDRRPPGNVAIALCLAVVTAYAETLRMMEAT